MAGDHHAGPPRRPRSLSAALLDRLDRPGAEVPRCAPLAPPQPQEGHSSLSPNAPALRPGRPGFGSLYLDSRTEYLLLVALVVSIWLVVFVRHTQHAAVGGAGF